MKLLTHVALSESLLHSGLARGRVDVEAIAQVLQAFHRTGAPLQTQPLHLQSLLWALSELPEDLGPGDTVWVSDKHDEQWSRIGPSEWAIAGGYARLRHVALALASLIAASKQLRALDDETLGELAYRNDGFEEVLALALGLDINALKDATTPKLFDRMAMLAQHPFQPTLRARPFEDDRAHGLWRELLQSLSSLDADHRPLIIWVAPLWVSDLVSPYTREVQPLLARWARDHAGLPSLADAISKGDADATYMVANLFNDPEVLAEREDADASVGIFTISDPNGVRVARVIDCARLDVGLVDHRLVLEEMETPAPIVIVLNGADHDVGYAVTRLLCDVSANYRAISVCMGGLGESAVGTSRMAQTANGAMILAAPAADLVAVRPLGLPDLAYLQLFDWKSDERDAVFPVHAAVQEALGEAMWRGDLTSVPMLQRFWLEPEGDDALLDAKRAHIADALSQWRAFLGVEEPAQEPEPPARNKPKAGSMRFRA